MEKRIFSYKAPKKEEDSLPRYSTKEFNEITKNLYELKFKNIGPA
jgi:hypothetical protein